MKILLHTKAFHPMVGGIETVSATLAELLTKLGQNCEIITPVANTEPDTFSYKVHRKPGFIQTIKLVFNSDVVISKGASLSMVPYCMLLRKPFIWIHSGYQASCVDGLGWVDGAPSPLTPGASIAYHCKRSGLCYAAKSAFKLYLRRFACKHIVAMNVAVSDWVAMRQPFKNQIRIHNPFPIYRFADSFPLAPAPTYRFLYLGRLVSEKGVATLIKALALLMQQNPSESIDLLIVGDGAWRSKLEKLVTEVGVEQHVTFAGRKTGRELQALIQQCEIAVVPSEWEEPMGGVALELLAAGKPLIVSRAGGLAECVGDAALLFENGDHAMLAYRMKQLLGDEELKARLRENAKTQLEQFDPEKLATQYIALFDYVLGTQKRPREKSTTERSAREAESIN